MEKIRVINGFPEFLAEIRELFELVESSRKQRREEYRSIGLAIPSRIKFEELDLHKLVSRLLSVHKTLQWRGHNHHLNKKDHREDGRKARVLAIAGICELIKDEFVGKFWDAHRRIIGWGPDTTVYDWIWEKGFGEEKIPLVLSACRREFVQTLVLESGVPKNRIRDIIDFFVIYWRYLSSSEDVETLIEEIIKGTQSLSNIPLHDRYRLQQICTLAADFSKAFAVAVRKLTTIFNFISSCEEIYRGEIEQHTELIYRKTGVNPLEVLRDKEQLKTIYRTILGILTPAKLERILLGKPAGTRIQVPDGRTIRTDTYKEIQYGEHILEGATFTCVPTPRLQSEDLRRLPFNRIVRIGPGVLLKSRSKIRATVNGKNRPDLVLRLYLQQFEANIFYVEQAPAMLIALRTDDGQIDTKVGAVEGFLCSPFLHYSGNFKRNIHSLYASFSSLRIMAPALAGSKLAVKLSLSTDQLATLALDSDGQGYCSERAFPITSPSPEIVRLRVTKTDSDETVLINGKPVEAKIELAPAILFSPYYGKEFPATLSGKVTRYGGKKFVLYASDAEQATITLNNLKATDSSTQGRYKVMTLTWDDHNSPCHIDYALNGKVLSWGFEKCLHFNLYVKKIREQQIEHIDLGPLQGVFLDDFDITINPIPLKEFAGKLVWGVSVNNATPVVFPFTEGPQGYVDGPSIKLCGDSLAALLSRTKMSANENARVEISLGIEEHIFSSVCFWVFPDVKVMLPRDLQQGDSVSLTARVGDREISNILVKDRRGRTQLPPLIHFEDSTWQLKEHPFHGKLDLEEFGTHLDIRVVPAPRGIRLGHLKTGTTEPVRDLLRREVSEFDLLIIYDGGASPYISVNKTRISPSFRWNGGSLWSTDLASLPGLIERENSVVCRAGEHEATFGVRYRVGVLSAEFIPVSAEIISGTLLYTGPAGAAIEIALFEDPTAPFDRKIAGLKIFCDGKEHLDQSVEIEVPTKDWTVRNGLYIRLYLSESCNSAVMLEFGETWHVDADFAGKSTNVLEYIEKAETAMKDQKVFLASKYLDLAMENDQLTADDRALLGPLKSKILGKQLNVTLKSFAGQSLRILKKEFLLDL